MMYSSPQACQGTSNICTYYTWYLNPQGDLSTTIKQYIPPTSFFQGMLEHDCYTSGIRSRYKHGLTHSPHHLLCTGQVRAFVVFWSTLSKQWETSGVYWSKHLSCKQITMESFKQSSSSPPCHLPLQERASPDTASACWAIQTAHHHSSLCQGYLMMKTRPDTLKAALWKSLGGFLVGYRCHFWKISQSYQLHKQSQCQTGHYFKLERIFWCYYTWKKNGSYFAQHGLLKHLMRGNPYHEKAVKHHRRKLRFFY